MRFSIFLAFSGLIASSCSSQKSVSNDTNAVTSNGFEQSVGWGSANEESLTNEKARNGQWSICVKPDVPFSYTYARSIGKIGVGPSQKVVLTAWVLRVAAGSTAKLVVQIDSSATNEHKVFYEALSLDKEVPTFGQWKEVRMALTLPATAKNTNQFKIYLWNADSSAPTYMDDVTLRKGE